MIELKKFIGNAVEVNMSRVLCQSLCEAILNAERNVKRYNVFAEGFAKTDNYPKDIVSKRHKTYIINN